MGGGRQEKQVRKYPAVKNAMKKIQWTAIEIATWIKLLLGG